MLRRIFLLSFLFCLYSEFAGQSRVQRVVRELATEAFFDTNEEGYYVLNSTDKGENNVRLTAIALNVTLGVFGMHRLYLGTDVKVPVFYTLTFGGGMVLWIADLGCLIFTKDISQYYNNPHLFMWNKPEDQGK